LRAVLESSRYAAGSVEVALAEVRNISASSTRYRNVRWTVLRSVAVAFRLVTTVSGLGQRVETRTLSRLPQALNRSFLSQGVPTRS
jgi:hypothetical protein